MEINLLELQHAHAEERKSLLHKRHTEREELSLTHQDRLQKSKLINADPISRSAALISSAQELTSFTLKYLQAWTDMEDRHKMEIESFTEKARNL